MIYIIFLPLTGCLNLTLLPSFCIFPPPGFLDFEGTGTFICSADPVPSLPLLLADLALLFAISLSQNSLFIIKPVPEQSSTLLQISMFWNCHISKRKSPAW